MKKVFDISKNHTTPGNPYYLVLFENRTKPGTVLSETILSGDPLYINLTSSNSTTKDTLPRLFSSRDILLCTGTYDILFLCTM